MTVTELRKEHTSLLVLAVAFLLILVISPLALATDKIPDSRGLPAPRPFNPHNPHTPYSTNDSYPHLAGYMTGSYMGVNGVMVTVNFEGTPQSDIQSSNRLIAGEWSTVFSTISGLDYGYRAVVVYPGSGSMYLVAQVDEFCEGFPGFTDCGSTPWTKNLYATTSSPSMGRSDSITVFMAFYGNTAYWDYSINGGSFTGFGQFTPPSDSHTTFEVGTYNWNNIHLVKYFQFGIDSDSVIGNTGWQALISNPQYQSSSGGSWTVVPHANAVQGSDAFLDARWIWGGADYTDTSDSVYQTTVLFYSSTSTVSNGSTLW